MKSNNAEMLVRSNENYIFYICLAIVLAIAAFGIANDVIAGR